MLMLPSPVLTLYFLLLSLCDAAMRHRRPLLGPPRGRLLGGSHSRIFNGHRGNFGRSVNGGFGRSIQPLQRSQKIQPRGEIGKRFHPRYQEALKSHGYDLGRYPEGGPREWNQHRQALNDRQASHDHRYRGSLDHRWGRGDGRNQDPRYRESQIHNWGQVGGRDTARVFGRGPAELGYRGNLYNNFFATPLRNGYWSRYGRYYGPGFVGGRYTGIGYRGMYYPELGLNLAIGGSNRTSSEFNTGRDPSSRSMGHNLEQSSLRGSERFFSGNAGERGNLWERDRSRNFTRGGGGEAGNVEERKRFGNFPLRAGGFMEGGRNLNTLEEIRLGGRGGTGMIEKGRNENLPLRAEVTVHEGNSGNVLEGERETTGGSVDRGSTENFSDRAAETFAEKSRFGNIPERARGPAYGKELSRKPEELERKGAKRGGAGSLLDERSGNFPERLGKSLTGRDRSEGSAKEKIETKENAAGSIIDKGHFGNFPGGTGSVKEKDRIENPVREDRMRIEGNSSGRFIEQRRGGGVASEQVRSETVGGRGAAMERSRFENFLGREANMAETQRFENFADVVRSKESAVERAKFGNSAGEGGLGKTGERGSLENVAGGREGKAVLEGSFVNGGGFYGGFYDDFMRYSILGGTLWGVSDITRMAASTLTAGAIQSQIMQNSSSEQLTQNIQTQQNTTKKSKSCVATFAYMATNGSPVYKCECSGEISYQYNRCVAPGG